LVFTAESSSPISPIRAITPTLITTREQCMHQKLCDFIMRERVWIIPMPYAYGQLYAFVILRIRVTCRLRCAMIGGSFSRETRFPVRHVRLRQSRLWPCGKKPKKWESASRFGKPLFSHGSRTCSQLPSLACSVVLCEGRHNNATQCPGTRDSLPASQLANKTGHHGATHMSQSACSLPPPSSAAVSPKLCHIAAVSVGAV